jgi:hypothetical protein
MIYDARAAQSLQTTRLPVEVLDDWRIMPAIGLIQPLALDRGYCFPQRAIGDAPTAAMEAEGS